MLHKVAEADGGRYYWQDDSYPASGLSLRSATSENYTITDITIPQKPKVIGTMDRRSAPTLIFPDAIYFHGGRSYIVETLDTEKMQCFIREIDAEYYTDGDAALRINITDDFETQGNYGWGEVLVTETPTIFKKIKLATHENAGFGQINLPEEQMHTTACWIMTPESRAEDAELKVAMEGLEHLLRNTAPLFLMCDRSDIRVTSRVKDPQLRRPAIYIIDNIPGGRRPRGRGLRGQGRACARRARDAELLPVQKRLPSLRGRLRRRIRRKGSRARARGRNSGREAIT